MKLISHPLLDRYITSLKEEGVSEYTLYFCKHSCSRFLIWVHQTLVRFHPYSPGTIPIFLVQSSDLTTYKQYLIKQYQHGYIGDHKASDIFYYVRAWFGLTGSQIEFYLRASGIVDTDPYFTKWKRLFNALVNKQNESKAGNCVLTFIAKALAPTRFIGKSYFYRSLLEKINTVLLFHGLEFQEDGKFHKVSSASTLSEAEIRASKLTETIASRRLHNHLLKFCRAELLQNNYFHAGLEATKSIASMIREKTGLMSDGAALLDEAFSGSTPILKINSYATESEKGEQKGFVNLAKGLFGTFRNPTAHSARIEWSLSEEDAIDLFTLASYVLRRIEKSS